MMSAEDLGKKLLAEVEEVGLDEILETLRLKEDIRQNHFGHLALDGLFQAISEARLANSKYQPGIPIIELLSTYPGGGKTHLLYHLTALAVLPTYLGGRQTAVVIIDTDYRFFVRRLAQQMLLIAKPFYNADKQTLSLKEIIADCLKHVHIFFPQSIGSTIATLQSLQSYLFDASKHRSFDRVIGFIALDSASAFYWQNKADVEHAALVASTSGSKSAPKPSGYIQLAATLKHCSKAFNAPVIFTTTHLGPRKDVSLLSAGCRAVKPSLPPPWHSLPTFRLLIRRVPVRSLPVEITVGEALRESEMRQKVVEQGKFECFVNEWGLDEKIVQKLHQGESVFELLITDSGVSFPTTSNE